MILQRVAVKKLWGERSFSLNLNEDVNILIGGNGSGKTTIISLIAAVLQADFGTLERTDFESVQIQLLDPTKKTKKVSIEVSQENNRSPLVRLVYKILEGKEVVSSSETAIRNLTYPGVSTLRYGVAPIHLQRYSLDVRTSINKYIRVNWLNLNRSGKFSQEAPKNHTIDQKVTDLSAELVKYFSEIDSEVRIVRDRFQKSVFLKLIQRRTEPQLINWVKGIDLKAEQKAIREILNSFSVGSEEWEVGFDSHFTTLRNVLKEVEAGEKKGFTFNEFEALIAMQHLHAVVQDWDALVAKQTEITENRTRFSVLLAELMPSKDFSINAKNELEVALRQTARPLSLTDLSSGEKQLLILLGEALLQRGKQFLYIADEPELSLHVTWQERIIQVVRSLNPHAQILFATHSPDLVGEFGAQTIDTEKLINGAH